MWERFMYVLVFLAEGITAWMYYDNIFDRKSKNRIVRVSFALGYGALFLLSSVENVWVNGLSFLLINGSILFLNYSANILPGVLHLGYLCIILFGTEILVAQFLMIFSGEFTAYLSELNIMTAFVIISRMIYFFIMQFSAKLLKRNKEVSGDMSLILLAVLPLTSIIIAVALSVICISNQLSSFSGGLVTICILLLLFANIAVMVIYNRVQKINRERLNYELQAQNELHQTEYYDMLQQQYNNQRVLIHDISRHIRSLSALLKSKNYEEANRYLDYISKDPVFTNTRICDEPVLNMILIRYRDLCSGKNITCNFDVRSGVLSTVRKNDITALFDNLISNAYEAAGEVQNGFINLSVISDTEDEILIKMVNSCAEVPAQDTAGNFITRKTDKQSHGIGMKSIDKVVRAYDGNSVMEYQSDTKTLTTIILLNK